MISERDIEPNPDKIKAILNMQSLREYKDIQTLTGKFYWDEEYDKYFEELKEYLGSPKLLSQPEPGETLQLYLTVSEGGVSSVLIHEAEEKQRPIYYVSRVLHGSKENYLVIDKFAFASVISERKQKIYFESHPIQVVTDHPMNRVITSPQLSGSSRNEKGSGAEILIRGPNNVIIEYALRFAFPTTNNETEYEAMVAGLVIVQSLGINRIWVKEDSKLIIDQVKGICGKI
ncbi:hypothetical protein LIER_09124 [Lithospermum erythrorhizon]|uniref:Reverse transcriptase domain-containing protein n=1 Tax=Lithospermum erythrorhizon TaxID=34254 RepID=A0AAV3PFU0_LITER